MNNPIIRKYGEDEWEFIFPPSMGNKDVFDLFWEGVDFLDYNDLEAEKIFKKIIAKHPFHIDAYNHLSIAFRNQNKTFESLLTAEKSYKIGKACFPKEFKKGKDKLIWSCLDNRPFLRACQCYGLENQYHNDFDLAIKLYEEILTLNENDNQGIRYLLLETFLSQKDYKKAKRLLNKYPDDYSIEFKFGIVSLNVIEGNYAQADKYLAEAIDTNKYFIQEVVKPKHIKPAPFRIPNEPNFDAGIPIGSVQQAYDYWVRNKNFYKNKKLIEYYKTK